MGLVLLPFPNIPFPFDPFPTPHQRPDRVANVLVFSSMVRTPLITALGIDTHAINMTVVTPGTLATMSIDAFNASLSSVDVIFIDKLLPEDPDFLHLLASHVNGTKGHVGLVVFGFLQNGTIPGVGDMNASQVTTISSVLPVDIPVSYTNSTSDEGASTYAIHLEQSPVIPENASILWNCIPWTECPLVDRRLLVTAKPGALTLLTGQGGTEPILVENQFGENGSRAIFFSLEITRYNVPFSSAIYFPYLMYACTFHALYNYSDGLIESWDEWPFSPGSGGDPPWFAIALVGALAVITIALRVRSRKAASKKPPATGDEHVDPRALADFPEDK